MSEDYGVKISKDGVDVDTASAEDLVYSSKWSNFKIHSVVSGSVTTNASGYGAASVDSPLSYSPLFLAYCQDPDNTTRWSPALSGYYSLTVGSAHTMSVAYNVSTNKFDMVVKYGGDTKTHNFKISFLLIN